MVQKTFRLHVSRLPGETSHGFDWRQRNLAANIKGHGNAESELQAVNRKLDTIAGLLSQAIGFETESEVQS